MSHFDSERPLTRIIVVSDEQFNAAQQLVRISGGLFAFAPVGGGYVRHVLPVMVVMLGVGAGLAFPALMTLAMTGVTGENAGLAAGLVNTTAQVGAALGLAVLATLSATRSATLSAQGDGVRAALTGGYHLAFWVAAALVAAAIAVALLVVEPVTGSASPDGDADDAAEPVAMLR